MFKRFYTLLNIVFVQAFYIFIHILSQSYFVKIKISLKKNLTNTNLLKKMLEEK